MICPNINDPSWKKLVQAVGEEHAYYLWDKNGGNPLTQTPDGKTSNLFNDLLALTHGNSLEAMSLKATIHSHEFLSFNESNEKEPQLVVLSSGNHGFVNKAGREFPLSEHREETPISYDQRTTAAQEETQEDYEAKRTILQNSFKNFDIDVVVKNVKNPKVVMKNGRATIQMPEAYPLGHADTLFHEHAHIMIDALGGLSNEHIAFGRRQLEGTALEKEILAKYKNVSDEVQSKEVLAQAIGIAANKLFEDTVKHRKWNAWLKVLFNRLKATLGLNHDAVMELARKLMNDELVSIEISDAIYDQKVAGTPWEDINTIDELRDNLLERVRSLHSHWKRSKNTSSVAQMEDLIEEMVQYNDIRSAIMYVQKADTTTASALKQFKAMRKKFDSGEMTPADMEAFGKLMHDRKVFVSTFELIPQVKALITEGKVEFDKKSNKELGFKKPIKKLDEVTLRLNEINSMYDQLLEDYMVEKYHKDTDFVQALWGRKYEKEFHKIYRAVDRKALGAEAYKAKKEAWVSGKMQEHSQEIEDDNKLYLRKSLNRNRGYINDISGLSRWAADPRSIEDTIMQIAIKQLDKLDFEIQVEYGEALRAPVEVFNAFADSRGNSLNQEEMYKGFYEEIDGKKTGYYLGKYKSTFSTERNSLWKAWNDAAEAHGENSPEAETAKATYQDWKIINEEQPYSQAFREKSDKIQEGFHNTERHGQLTKERSKIKKRYMVDGQFQFDKMSESDLVKWNNIKTEIEAEKVKTAAANKATSKEFFKLWKSVPTARYNSVNKHNLATMSQEDYDVWFHANHHKAQRGDTVYYAENSEWTTLTPKDGRSNNPKYRDGKITPVSKWINPTWSASEANLSGDTVDGNMFRVLKENSAKVDELYGNKSKRRKNYTDDVMSDTVALPRTEKTTAERLVESGVKATFWEGIKDQVKKRSTDFDLEQDVEKTAEWDRFVKVIVDEEHKVKNFIPIYFRNDLKNMKDQSYDLMSIEMMDLYAAMNFEKKHKLEPDMMIIQDAMANRKVAKQKGFKYMVNSILPMMKGENFKPVDIEGVHSNVYQAFQSMVENRMYNIGVKDAGSVNVWGNKISLNKVSNTIAGYTGSVLLTFNWLSSGAASMQGNTLNMSEAFGGTNLTTTNMKNGHQMYLGDFKNVMGDIGRVVAKSKTNALLERYDPSGNYNGLQHKFAHRGVLKQTAAQGLQALNFTHWQEHQVQATLMYGLLDAVQLKTKEGNDISLAELYMVDENGNLGFKPVTDLTDVELRAIEQKAHRKIKEITKKKHGNYDGANKAEYQRTVGGQQAGMLRKWLIPGIQHRFRNLTTMGKNFEELEDVDLYYNESGDEFQEGIYTTTARFLRQFNKELRTLQFTVVSAEWDKLTDKERGNIRQSIFEAGAMLGSYLAFLAFLAFAEDQDEEWAYVPAFYMRRLFGELAFYAYPMETFRILRSPAASLSMVERLMGLATQGIYDTVQVATGGEATRYLQGERKGDLKLWRKTKQLLPVSAQIERNVEEALGYLQQMMVNQ